jgi:hypothetical protein
VAFEGKAIKKVALFTSTTNMNR